MYIFFFPGKTSVQLQIDIQSDSVLSQQHLDVAIKCGLAKEDALDVNKYVVVFLRKLLLQREKHNEHLLENYLNREIDKRWQEVLSSLEERNRKLINVQSGSFILTLFCPTRESRLQLHDGIWKDEIQAKLTDLLKLLGKFWFVEIKKYKLVKGECGVSTRLFSWYGKPNFVDS